MGKPAFALRVRCMPITFPWSLIPGMPKMTSEARGSARVSLVADTLEGLFGRPTRPARRSNPLNTLIATLLSQNTNDRNSYRAWLALRKKFPTWKAVDKAPWRAIARAIEVGGLKNQKAQRIKRILRTIHRGKVGYDLDFLKRETNEAAMAYLLSMKGVGKKTAACVLVFSLGRDVFPVDTHIHRICNRLGIAKTKSADDTYSAMQTLVPSGKAYSFHVNLIRFGRRICRSSVPLCDICPLFDECTFPGKHEFASRNGSRRATSLKRGDFLITERIALKRSPGSTLSSR
jgi:endonuclease-3